MKFITGELTKAQWISLFALTEFKVRFGQNKALQEARQDERTKLLETIKNFEDTNLVDSAGVFINKKDLLQTLNQTKQ